MVGWLEIHAYGVMDSFTTALLHANFYIATEIAEEVTGGVRTDEE
jgi:phage tail protein X